MVRPTLCIPFRSQFERLFFALDIINRVKNAEFPPFRPTVTQLITGVEEIRELMKQCWVENPDERPDFHEIKKIMHKVLVNNGM